MGTTLLVSKAHFRSCHNSLTLLSQGSLIACEFLMLNGSKFDISDKDEMTPLHLATELGHTG